MNFISGEKIQLLCDHFIGKKGDFNLNPKIKPLMNRHLPVGSLKEGMDNKTLIFYYNNGSSSLQELIEMLKYMKNPFKLAMCNSDGNFEERMLILFEELPLLKHVYTQNMNVNHPKVDPLPIGFANSMWSHGNPKIHREVYNMKVNKTKNIYFNFNINTNRKVRQKCHDQMKKKGLKWINNMPYRDYLIELKRHKFAISPEGNGIDCHRFWECLYMNVIPICKRNKLVEYYSKYFPIVILEDWNHLEVEKLKYTSYDHSPLDMKYIERMIRSD